MHVCCCLSHTRRARDSQSLTLSLLLLLLRLARSLSRARSLSCALLLTRSLTRSLWQHNKRPELTSCLQKTLDLKKPDFLDALAAERVRGQYAERMSPGGSSSAAGQSADEPFPPLFHPSGPGGVSARPRVSSLPPQGESRASPVQYLTLEARSACAKMERMGKCSAEAKPTVVTSFGLVEFGNSESTAGIGAIFGVSGKLRMRIYSEPFPY